MQPRKHIRRIDLAQLRANVTMLRDSLPAGTQLLAVVKINIANMSLCRDRRGGDALMVIETDEKIPPVARALIGELENIKSMTYYEKEDT